MIDKERTKQVSDRLLKSRMRILQNHGFFGLLLMHCIFTIDKNCQTAATDGQRIYWGLDFLQSLSDWELDIVMLHEIMHIVLKHCFRGKEFTDHETFNVACDIVINSGIMRELELDKPIVLGKYGTLMHLAPNGEEGYLYTAEQVYDMLQKQSQGKQGNDSSFCDDHSKWDTLDDPEFFQDKWEYYSYSAAVAAESFQNAQCNGLYSKELRDRILKKLRKPQLDWRTILNNFVQEEVTDYSWSPPDKRYEDSDFFLPDFNEKEDFVQDILFMIDTSRSMSEEQVTTVFSEVKGALEQFNGRLRGKLGFFLYKVVEPIDFESVDSLLAIKPKGGGGTSFTCVFEYVNEKMKSNPPTCIILLTDGHAVFPDESITNGIPVLWLLNNEFVHPPWGKIARIKDCS